MRKRKREKEGRKTQVYLGVRPKFDIFILSSQIQGHAADGVHTEVLAETLACQEKMRARNYHTNR